MSSITISTNQTASTTTISFTVTGTSGTTGYGNITIPKSAVPYGTTPTVYIDGQKAANQTYTQDGNNYYVWYETHFSTHKVAIEFAGKAVQPTSLYLVLAVVVVVIAIILATVAIAVKRGKTGKKESSQ